MTPCALTLSHACCFASSTNLRRTPAPFLEIRASNIPSEAQMRRNVRAYYYLPLFNYRLLSRSVSTSVSDALHRSQDVRRGLKKTRIGKCAETSVGLFHFLSETMIGDIVHVSLCASDLVYFRALSSESTRSDVQQSAEPFH